MSVPIVGGLQSVSGCGCIVTWNETCVGGFVFLRGDLVGAVLCKVAKFITAVKLHIRAVVTRKTCLSTNKASSIIRHHADHRGCQHGC